eukprot:m.111037 g.111037  ORF g.111037 m.111037 type:complete len:81 (+) comp51816_c0_seq11:680-922(+)
MLCPRNEQVVSAYVTSLGLAAKMKFRVSRTNQVKAILKSLSAIMQHLLLNFFQLALTWNEYVFSFFPSLLSCFVGGEIHK